jgi:protein-S-isoprenylcysteine O-methyltransferase Ste14
VEKPSQRTEKIKKFLQRKRVAFGFLFAIIFLVFSKPERNLLIVGGVTALIGLLIRAWASGHIRKNQVLAVSGPYSFTRNPLYLGSFFLGVGFTIASGVWWLGIVFAVLYLGIYLPVMRVEAEELTAIFGDVYTQYAAKVPLFFPLPTSYKSGSEKFDLNLYLRYREYRAALGLLFALSVLALKVYTGINIW